MTTSKLVDLPDLANARDLGGLRTRDGGRTRYGQLLRSATPHFLDATQAARLTEDVGVRLRIDLRSRGEIAELPNDHLTALEHQVLHAPIRSAGTGGPLDMSQPARAMVKHYLRFLDHSAHSFARIAETVATGACLPALVHCTLGKDRTGVTVGILLSAVGVVDDDITEDYSRTEGQNDALLVRLRTLPAYRTRLDLLPAESFAARPETMVGFLGGLDERYGGGAGYLRSIGVTPTTLDALTDCLVERD